METPETINYRFRESVRRNFKIVLYGSLVGIAIAVTGFYRNYYQTGNIPGLYPLKTTNSIMVGTGIGIQLASMSIALGRNIRAKRKRDSELESSLEDSPPQTFVNRILNDQNQD